jgi:hypothetical protein
MLKLNLLSKEAKKEVKYKRLYALVARVDFMILIGVIFIATVFSSAKVILVGNFQEFADPGSLLRSSGQEYNEKIKEINAKLSLISQIQGEFVQTSLLVKELTDRIPSGVFLSYIKADIANQNLKIMGRAQERNDFLSLREKLSESKVFLEVESPLQNILQKENIDFEINIKLNLPELGTTKE